MKYWNKRRAREAWYQIDIGDRPFLGLDELKHNLQQHPSDGRFFIGTKYSVAQRGIRIHTIVFVEKHDDAVWIGLKYG